MHLLNASAAEIHRVALPGHKFQVIALDGNPVPTPQPVDVIEIAPGERVDAIVEMNNPGVWILGEIRDAARQGGMGRVVEYANKKQRALWTPPPNWHWDYTIFGTNAAHPPPDHTIDMVFEKIPRRTEWNQSLARQRQRVSASRGIRVPPGTPPPDCISQPQR